MENEKQITDLLSSSDLIMDAAVVYACVRLVRNGYRDIGALIHNVYTKTEIGNHLKAEGMDTAAAELYGKKYKNTVEEAVEAIKALHQETVHSKYEAFAILQYALVPLKPRVRIAEVLLELINEKIIPSEKYSHFAHLGKVEFKDDTLYCSDAYTILTIGSIARFTEVLNQVLPKDPGHHIFYRGHAEASFEMVPTLFRENRFKHNEANMYCELLNTCPDDFSTLPSHIDRLTEMQHYGLPTRLLDITSNPLTALWFACNISEKRNGEVILLSVEGTKLKYAQSRTIAMMASIPLMGYENQVTLYEKKGGEEYDNAVQALMEEVNTERPGFVINQQMEDNLENYYVVMPNRINRRVDRQEGAFIICGLMEEFYGNDRKPHISAISDMRIKNEDGKKVLLMIEAGRKKAIMNELDKLGVNKSSLFPEIDDVADDIKNKVR